MSIFLLLGTGCEPKSADHKAVANVWEQIMSAWESSNGKAVVALSSKGTIEYYDRLVKLGLGATASEVKKLTPFEKLEIVMMRHRGKRSELRKLDGKGYIEYATSKGWYSGGGDPEGPLYYELGKIKVGKDKVSAWAEVYFNDDNKRRKSDYAVKFFKEDGAWKLDETSIHLMLSHEIGYYARMLEMNVDSFIVMIEEESSGFDVPDSIWSTMQ